MASTGFAPDLARIHQAGLALQQSRRQLLDPHCLAARAADGDYESFRSRCATTCERR